MSDGELVLASSGYFVVGLVFARLVWQMLTHDLNPHDDTFAEGWCAFGALILWPLIPPGIIIGLFIWLIIEIITWKPEKK